MKQVDLVVIGAGPAGEKGAAQAAYFNKRVAIIDRGVRPGGIAVSKAGIPTKTLREGAIYLSGVGQEALAKVHRHDEDPWSVLMKRRLDVSDFMTKAVERNLRRHGIEEVRGRARLLPDRRVEVELPNGTREIYQAQAVLLATGSRPRTLPGVSIDDPDIHDSDGILEIDRAPESLAVLGGGSIGCEYASIFATLGVQVTIVDAGDHLLPSLDVEMARVLAESFNSSGVRVITNAAVDRVDRTDAGLEVQLAGKKKVVAQKVLVAVGRRPAIDELGLEEAGVARDEAGWVKVDERYQTTVPGVFAAGDMIGPPGLASFSMEQARVAVCHAFGFDFKKSADRFRPTYVFCIPEVASVGITEEEAKRSGIDYEIGRSSFSTNAKARISGFQDGLIKLLFRATDKTLLGVHIVGEVATELIHIGQLVMHGGGTIDRFIDATFAVPTRSEAYKYAAYDGLMRLEKRQAARSVDLKGDPVESGRVIEAIRLAPKVTNVRIACESLAGFVFEAGADVVLRLPEDRRYSVWKSSTDGTFDVCVVGHGMGPGSRWSTTCRAGEPISFSRSKALPIALDPEARAHVFIGDETSIAGAEALIRKLAPEVPVLACFETPSEAERWPREALLRPDAVRWIDRSGRPGAGMIEWLKSRAEPLLEGATAYVTGETWLCAMVHSHLSRERGFSPARIRAMPYWKQRRTT